MKKKNSESQNRNHELSVFQQWKEGLVLIFEKGVLQHLIIAFVLSYCSIIGMETLKWWFERDQYLYEAGDIATEDVVLQEGLRFLDQEATERKRTLRASTANPQFVMQESITLQVLNRFDNFFEPFLAYLDEDEEAFSPELLEQMPIDSLRALEELEDPQQALISVREVIVTVMYQGFVRLLPRDDQPWDRADFIDIVASGGSQAIRTTTTIGDILTRDNVEPFVDSMLPLQISNQERDQIRALVLFFIEENCYYNQILTEQHRNQLYQVADPVYISYNPGDVLIYQGAELTSRDMDKLHALQAQLGTLGVVSFLYPFFYLWILLFLPLAFLVFSGRRVYKPQNMILSFYFLTFFLIVLQVVELFSTLPRENLNLIILPAALISLMLSQLLDRKEDLLFYTILMALGAFFISKGSEIYLIFVLVSSITGLLVLPKGEKRIDLLRAGVLLGLVHFLIILALTFYRRSLGGAALVDLVLALLSGPVASLLVMFLLPLFEQFMNSCTTFRLTELSNLNDPIMKRMFIRAPGTYVHSINVAYMAEPACKSIGANSLLARVGGYYHDIGKIDQAEYYIENQKEGNKHDELKASLSAAIIKSHVKAGVEKARELKLPNEIVEIIAQHHGTSLIRYFYDRAMKNDNSKATVKKEDFCHPGPRPQTKEAAVVMLADTVEAATRTLRKPTRAKLEKYIWELMIDRFQTGELNDSGLTLKELEIIKENFVHVLTGHFHSRIEYPKGEEERG